MSGIYGIYNANASGKEQNIDAGLSLLSKWNLAYGDGQHDDVSFANIGMGICPEHITNAPVNKAPIIRRDNFVAVIDAVIYNRDELISQYDVSATLSDEEMLLECVLSHGYDILSGVNGDFCGAILNTTTRKMLLFRDHMGIRPLFFYRSPEWMGFSSDIRGLIALPDMSADVNPDWLYRAVCGYDTADYIATEISDVYFVKPASYLVISEGASGLIYVEHVYWKLGSRKIRFRSNKAYCRHLLSILLPIYTRATPTTDRMSQVFLITRVRRAWKMMILTGLNASGLTGSFFLIRLIVSIGKIIWILMCWMNGVIHLNHPRRKGSTVLILLLSLVSACSIRIWLRW